MANKLARITVSLVGGNRAAGEAGKVSKSLDRLRRQTLSAGKAGTEGAAGLSSFERRILSIDTQNGRLSRSLGLTSRALGALKFAAVGAGTAAAGVAAHTVKAGLGFNAAFQSATTSFTTMLGSGERASKFMEELRDVSSDTPLRFTEVLQASKQMLGFGMSADQARDTLKSLNMAVLATGGNEETFHRGARALGQMEARGKASAEELRQLAEAGIPVNKILQKELGLTGEQVSNIGQEGIESSKVIDAITKGWADQFGEASKNAANDWSNQTANMRKDWEQLQRVVTAPLFERLNQDVFPQIIKGIRGAIAGMESGGIDGLFAGLDSGIGAGGRVVRVWEDLKDAGESVATIIREVFVPALTGAYDLLRNLPNPLGMVKDLLGLAARNTRTLAKVLKVLIAGYVVYRTLAIAVAAVQLVLIARRKVLIALETLHRRTMIAAMLAQSLWMKSSALMAGMLSRLRGLWIALNLVIRANPIMAAVTAMMLLGAALVLAYRKVGWFRDAVDATWSWIKDNWHKVLTFIAPPIALAVALVIRHWDTLKSAASSVVTWIKDRFAWVKDKLSAAFGIVARVGRAAFNLLKAPIEWLVRQVKWLLDKIPSLPTGIIGDVAGGIGSAAGGVFDAAGGIFDAVSGGRATGGPVTAGRTYLVGERGPELFTAPTMGRIVPNHALSAAMPAAASLSGTAIIHNHVILDGREVARSVNRVRLDEQARA